MQAFCQTRSLVRRAIGAFTCPPKSLDSGARRPSSTRARGTQDGARRPRASRRPSPAPPSSARVDVVGSPVASPRTAGVHASGIVSFLGFVFASWNARPAGRRGGVGYPVASPRGADARLGRPRGRAASSPPPPRASARVRAPESGVRAHPRARFFAQLAGSISAPAHRASRASRTLPAGAERTPVTANASASTRGVPASTRAPAVTPRWP